MFIDSTDVRKSDRLKAAAIAALFEAALAYALVVGLGVRPPSMVSDQLKLIGLLPEHPLPPPPKQKVIPPPKRAAEHKKRTPQKEGAASPANLRATPTEIVRPPPRMPIPVPPPVAAAPIAGTGTAPSAGASNVRGPGTGSGGQGNGTGSGDSGNGGGGGGGGLGTGPRWIKGKIKNKDYPRGAAEAGISGVVSVRYAVEIDGHATDCRVIHSSGNAELDEITCRLIEQRFRYKPATDRNGRPVRSYEEGDHEWIIGEPPKDQKEDQGD